MNRLRSVFLVPFFGAIAMAHASSGLRVEIQTSRSQGNTYAAADQAVRVANFNIAQLSRTLRKAPFYGIPTTLTLTQNGVPLSAPAGRGRGTGLNLVFDSSGSRAFPADYKDLLVAVFNSAQPVIDAVFGQPSAGGDVKISNFDADIGERDAVAGGYYLPNNGSGTPEIRFPVYADNVGIKGEVTAVNFVHCLLLAYLGPKQYFADGWNESLVRAAVMRVVRTSGALPLSLDRNAVEGVLESSYDVGPNYDWWNQSALGCAAFIAPNLRDLPLPAGGSTGGIYLLRFQMAGSAMQKVLVEYPGFAAEFNRRYYASPGSFVTDERIADLGQAVIDSLGTSGTIEGLPFHKWYLRQFILRGSTSPGRKLLVQPIAITSELSGTDYGVFGIQAHLFTTDKDGNESLGTAQSVPIFWAPGFDRIAVSAQDEKIFVAAGYGSVVPNFTNSFDDKPYRVVADVPVDDLIARCYLPAGAIATPALALPNNIYGTLVGQDDLGTYRVYASWPGSALVALDVTKGAFGGQIADASFEQSQVVTLTVKRVTPTAETTVLTRKVNKGPGALGVHLTLGELDTATVTIPKGISVLGFDIAPSLTDALELLGLPLSDALIARFNPTLAKYSIYPDSGPIAQGLGLFVRLNSAKTIDISGSATTLTPVAVALKPGWNLVSNPLLASITTANIRVLVGTQSPKSFDSSVGDWIGPDIFGFSPGAADPVSGAPETGTFSSLVNWAPGQAAYIRVLAPEGATLLFMPPGTFSPSRDRQSSPTGWTVKVTVSGVGGTADAFIGQRPDAGRGYDPLYDSQLPPGIGGLQLGIESSLYRDYRKTGAIETYKAKLVGLVPGKTYRLKIDQIEGRFPNVKFYDRGSGMRRTYKSPTEYSFRAVGVERQFEFSVAGAR